MCGQHNVRATAGDNTGHNTDKGHIPSTMTEIKIPDPAGNRTRTGGLEGRDSTDHATLIPLYKLLKIVLNLLEPPCILPNPMFTICRHRASLNLLNTLSYH